MKNINEPLDSLLRLAKEDKTPSVDVSCKVMKTLAQVQKEIPQEFALFAFTDAAAIAAVVTGSLFFLYAWQEFFTPWNLFFFEIEGIFI
jgi:hypothetical protein